MKHVAPALFAAIFTLTLTLTLTLTSCWPGWDFLFDQTPSREHRIEDLRVIAVEVEPASIVVSPAFLRDGGDDITLRVKPILFDPRGGDVDVDVSLCVGNTINPFEPCSSFVRIPERRRVVTTSTDDPLALGRVEFEETFTLTHEDILAMFESAATPPLQLGGVSIGVVVNVGRTFDGKRERERAELLFALEVDPFGEGTTPDLFEGSGGVNCRGTPSEGLCNPGAVGTEPVCGNGVVEGPAENCDPPTADGRCAEGCFANDFCFAVPTPMCVEAVTVNRRPVLESLVVLDDGDIFVERGEVPAGAQVVEVGGVIALSPGVPRFITPAVPPSDARDSSQPVFHNFGCEETDPGSLGFFECGLLVESYLFRVYVADARAELVSPGADNLDFFGNPVFEGETVGVKLAAGTAAGTREPLVVVLTDSQGGMHIATFTLEAQ